MLSPTERQGNLDLEMVMTKATLYLVTHEYENHFYELTEISRYPDLIFCLLCVEEHIKLVHTA